MSEMNTDVEKMKSYLRAFKETENDIYQRQLRIDELEMDIGRMGGGIIETTSSKTLSKNSVVENLVIRLDDARTKLDSLVEVYRKEEKRINDITNQLYSSHQRQVISLLYIDGKKWTDIAAIIFGDEEDYNDKIEAYIKRAQRIHGKALKNLCKICNIDNILKETSLKISV